ncbi:Cobyric acid synthase [Candidatus Hodgkinia cicadicola]|nr:Cobyric acid synthase [Candidatus Hodgkinia cicadicola]
MIQATSSGAGKTLLCSCLCKIAREMGINVAPFKAQNMSNNVVITADGGEVSSAQWLQAKGCGIIVSSNMNPVLVKPKPNNKSEIIVCGKLECNNYVYPGSVEFRNYIRERIITSFRRLSARHELIIIEGAGASSEVNLREYDTSNMWIASLLNCDVVLVSDIERGGMLASLVGTHRLLRPSESRLIKGYVVNKFSGELSILKPGLRIVSSITDWPCYGVIPWKSEAFKLPSEDSIWERHNVIRSAYVGIIIDLPFFCNYNDYAALCTEPNISVLYAKTPPVCVWSNIKFIIVPDVASVSAGLKHLLSLGWADYIREAHRQKVLIIGVGAGLLMLSDKFTLNNNVFFGFGILRASVSILSVPASWVTCYCKLLNLSISVGASKTICYNSTSVSERVLPLLANNYAEYGIYSCGIWGVCVQGLFLNDIFRHTFLKALGLQTYFSVYSVKVDKILSELAYSIAQNLSAEFISLIRDGSLC